MIFPRLRLEPTILIQGLLAFLAASALTLWGGAMLQGRGVAEYAPSEPVSLLYLLFVFGMVTVAIWTILATSVRREVFAGFFAFAIFIGIWFFFDAVLPAPTAVLLAAAVTLLRIASPRIVVWNASMAIGIAGIALSLGTALPPLVALSFLGVMAIYDIVAVYKTKHMVSMFKGLLAHGVVPAFILPEDPRMLLRRIRPSPLSGKSPSGDKYPSGHKSPLGDRPEGGVHLLGTGDLALPLLVVASAIPAGAPVVAGAVIGMLLGFTATHAIFFGQTKPRPMAALPPIAAGTALGFLVGTLFL
jgi:presenilin-like A22 family membrane protease